ncbi:MAG: hypothetical protein A2430_02855 [Candidatus Liptonbacteria bacterium RIFOXYC1_FULL_36_8]|uniref:PDZ domain-containing protein n=3 Tax=Candidatus Liptoniibacteriota TaxID=1817909 RepID=A0A1G2CM96_9BACT|nr:MAG: hypothetical protein A2390_01290 [Candidatus Liptonbacteria bacterium RIFOXYB1_FULL_36_10]OGZ04159.1 MAG: hypothetical protein A2430_02855 [Candidatus Liptonbacteria bacterium RIFOXYC1_FULL_36_8]OGZ04172.1 MAG: hypothetical protein A2604_02265 [Candidatus Liptonbacteria bacterium RIFOXYD1_FULL_36_11]
MFENFIWDKIKWMKENAKKIFKIAGEAIGVAVLLFIVFYLGFSIGEANPKTISVVGVPEAAEQGKSKDINFSTFWETWDLIKGKHLKGGEVDNQKLYNGAISGLVNSLGDPYSVFLPPEDSQKFKEDVDGNFGGVGMEIETKDGKLLVVAPLKGTPAERAGVEAGDYILKINGEDASGLDTQTAVKKIRGEIGTKVTINFFRDSWKEPRDVSITRENIQVPTLESEMKGDIAYIKLMSFNENSIPLFYEAMVKSLFSGSKGLVLDLRNNPGGYLEVATRLAGWFVDNGKVVVSEQFRDGKKTDFPSTGNAALKDFPTVILVNKGSASASEILAGALRDLRGIKLVGEMTFGKGTVQQLESLSDGSTLKITVAKWVLPSGKTLEGNGLVPDVDVKITEEDAKNKYDRQLEKALEILKKEMEKQGK